MLNKAKILALFISTFSLAVFAEGPNDTCLESTSTHKSKIKNLQENIDKVIIERKALVSILDCKTLGCIYSMSKRYPVRLTPHLMKYGPAKRFKFLQDFFKELLKAPPSVLTKLRRNGHMINLTILSDRKLVPPRGWNPDKPVVALQRGKKVLIAIDSLYKGHSSKNAVLHETFHLFDELHRNNLSLGSSYRKIHWGERWELDYYHKYPDEALAESFAKYYDSEIERSKLRNSNPLSFKYISKLNLK